MKTTSYEISKKLAEAGFKGGTDTLIHDPKHPITGERYASFCLETILEALPRTVVLKTIPKKIYELRVWFNSNENQIGYQDFQGFHPVLTVAQQENEPLADTAARLLLLLHEKNLIKF